MPLVVGMHGGRFAFLCVHLQQHAVSGNVTFIQGLVCVCRVTSVFFPPFPNILCLEPDAQPGMRAVPSANTWCMPTLRSAGRERGLALALSHSPPQYVSMALIWLFLNYLVFVLTQTFKPSLSYKRFDWLTAVYVTGYSW